MLRTWPKNARGCPRLTPREKSDASTARRLKRRQEARQAVLYDVAQGFNPRPAPSADRLRPGGQEPGGLPLPEGRGYREGRPGFAGRQARISLKGEVSNHKGNFDKFKALLLIFP
jgi:hypothetical protein